MSDQTLTQQIEKAAEIVSASKNGLAFTGAGISTESGIPDFRSPGSGLWDNVDPMAVASIYGFRQNPQAFYDWVRPLTELTINASPNPAHYAVVDLERMGYVSAVITQNIDMLHTRAGNNCIYELHGHLREGTCTHCFRIFDGEKLLRDFLEDSQVPKCTECGGVIKPNVILFGEQLPIRVLQASKEAARKCDMMLIVGTSLEVAPASDIPQLAHRNGAKIVIVNQEPTPADNYADVVIHERAAAVLPEIAYRLEART